MEGIEATDEIGVERIDRSEKDTDRNGDAQDRRECADVGPVFDEIRRDVQTGPRCDDGSDDHHLAVAPHQGLIAVGMEHLRRRHDVIDPPHA